MRGDSGVAGEGRVVGVPKFHSWGKCTMALTNIDLQCFLWLAYYIVIYLYYVGPLSYILACNM